MACDSIDKCTDGGLDFMREKYRLISHESIKIFIEVDCDASVVRRAALTDTVASTMVGFECKVQGKRVVVVDGVTPMTTLRRALELAYAKAKIGAADDAFRLTSTSTSPATHACKVDGKLTEDFDAPMRFLNLRPGAKIELDERVGCQSEARASAKAPVRVASAVARTADVATTTATTATTTTNASNGDSTGLDLKREFRVIRRSVEIEEGPGAPPEDLDDAFFELTKLDAMTMMKRPQEPILMTKKMRDAAEANKKRKVPTHAVIRFALPPPSDLLIEAAFLATETVEDLYAFADQCAASRDVSASMELFVTPPKRVLARKDASKTTLLAAGLAPAARVRVGMKGAPATYASIAESESLVKPELVNLAAGPVAPTVRIIDANTRTPREDAAPRAEPKKVVETAEEKKQKLMDKLAKGGAPKWFKL